MGSHTNSTIMESVESVVNSFNKKIDRSVRDHLATVYFTVFLIIQTATAGFYVGIENNILQTAPIFYNIFCNRAGYPWRGPGGFIDGVVTLWNVYLGIGVFLDDIGRKKPAGLVKLPIVLVVGYVTGGILAYFPITDINICMQWAPTLFIVQRTIHCFLVAAWSEPRDRKHFYMSGTFLSFLHNLFIIKNGTPALLLPLDLFCIDILIGPDSSLNLVGYGWGVFYGSLLSIFRETVLFGNWSPDDLYNGSTYITLAVICAYVIIYTERNLFPDDGSKEKTDCTVCRDKNRDFVTQALKFFFDFKAFFAVIVMKTGDVLWDWFVNEFIV